MGQSYLGSKNLRRGRTPAVFRHSKTNEIAESPAHGMRFQDNFFPYVAGRYKLTHTAGTSTAVAAGLHGGGLLLDSGAATAYHGPNLQLGTTGASSVATGLVTPLAGRTIYLQADVKLTTITNFPRFFFGLCTANENALASGSGLPDAASMIGFVANGTDGHLDFTSRLSDSNYSDPQLDLHTLVEDTYVKLEMVVYGLTKAIPWVNGVRLDQSALPAAAIPTLIMTPTFASSNHSGGGSRATMTILDWEIEVNDATDIIS